MPQHLWASPSWIDAQYLHNCLLFLANIHSSRANYATTQTVHPCMCKQLTISSVAFFSLVISRSWFLSDSSQRKKAISSCASLRSEMPQNAPCLNYSANAKEHLGILLHLIGNSSSPLSVDTSRDRTKCTQNPLCHLRCAGFNPIALSNRLRVALVHW